MPRSQRINCNEIPRINARQETPTETFTFEFNDSLVNIDSGASTAKKGSGSRPGRKHPPKPANPMMASYPMTCGTSTAREDPGSMPGKKNPPRAWNLMMTS